MKRKRRFVVFVQIQDYRMPKGAVVGVNSAERAIEVFIAAELKLSKFDWRGRGLFALPQSKCKDHEVLDGMAFQVDQDGKFTT